MANLLLVLLAICVAPALVAARCHFTPEPFLLSGSAYCDTCQCGFQNDASKYISGNPSLYCGLFRSACAINCSLSDVKDIRCSLSDVKEILDNVEKWKHASEEESWLDEYERDENRYSAGRGVHKNLKRAEKARILVSKLPSLVEGLTAKAKAWELEKGIQFLYNKAPLLHTLEEFTNSRQAKEEEKRRFREQKKLQDQLASEQEALFGSKPNVKKPLGQSTCAAC